MLPTRATGACVYVPQYFGGLGTNTSSVSRAKTEIPRCDRGERIEYLQVHHGDWVDGIRFKCSGVSRDFFDDPDMSDQYLIGETNDGWDITCGQEDDNTGSGVNKITAVFSSGNPNYLANMTVTCANGDDGNMEGLGFGDNFNSR